VPCRRHACAKIFTRPDACECVAPHRHHENSFGRYKDVFRAVDFIQVDRSPRMLLILPCRGFKRRRIASSTARSPRLARSTKYAFIPVISCERFEKCSNGIEPAFRETGHMPMAVFDRCTTVAPRATFSVADRYCTNCIAASSGNLCMCLRCCRAGHRSHRYHTISRPGNARRGVLAVLSGVQ
jgi:hypothetical protein